MTDHAVINPNTFTNPTDRFAAILSRADRITSNPKFKALSPQEQQHVLSRYYDKYVLPGYTSLGFNAPDKDLFLREMPRETGKLDSRAFYFQGDFTQLGSESQQRSTAAMGEAAGQVARGMAYAGIWLTKNTTYAALGLDHFLHLMSDQTYEDYKGSVEQQKTEAQNIVDKISNSVFDSDKFWLQTHPSKRWQAEIDSNIGEQIVQLPLFNELSALRVGAAAKAGEVIPMLGRAQNLTEKLIGTKGGQFIARRLANAADAYIGTTLFNKDADTHTKIMSMVSFMGFASGAEGLGAGLKGVGALLKYPTKFLIKQMTARNLAMGGKYFQEAISDAASDELANNVLGHNHNGDRVSIHPDSEDTGVIRVGDKEIRYNSRQEQQEAITKSIQAHQQHDPVTASTVNAEKITLTAMGREKFGKPWNQLSQTQRRTIREARAGLTREAVSEVPLHNPDLAKQRIEQEYKQEQQTHPNPELDQFIAQMEQRSGIKVTDALFSAEQEQLEEQTGIKQTQGTIEKIGKISDKVKRTTAKMESLRKAGKSDEELGPRRFAQMKIDNLAYFTNRARSAGDTKGLAAEIKDMDSDEFRHSILEQMGSKDFRFNNPEHALLWANSFRTELPKPFQSRLIKELHDVHPKWTIKDLDRKSANLSQHMKELAYTERLFTEDNIFRSTQIDRWTSKTQWQEDLRKEVEAKELAELGKTMKRSTKAFKFAAANLKTIQELRAKATTAAKYARLTAKIRGEE